MRWQFYCSHRLIVITLIVCQLHPLRRAVIKARILHTTVITQILASKEFREMSRFVIFVCIVMLATAMVVTADMPTDAKLPDQKLPDTKLPDIPKLPDTKGLPGLGGKRK